MYLFEHAEQVAGILDLLLEPEIEIPKLLPDGSNAEEVEELTRQKELRDQALKDTFEMVMGDFQDKAEAYGWILKELDARADAMKKAKLELEKKQRALTNRAERLKESMRMALERIGSKKLTAGTFTFSTRTSSSVMIDTQNVFEIPDDLLRYSDPEPDKTAIKNYLKEHPDCTWAHMEQKTSLIMK
ncbi:MAG: siphovirus Gp157 family protein [Clostridia bacterium]|nr:siphovirus Gp157 family protein [Clostridia bacterium]